MSSRKSICIKKLVADHASVCYLQREERFFSKAITHVITIRSIPPDSSAASLSRGRQANASQNQDSSTSSKTIDPSLLNRNAENQAPGQIQKSRIAPEVSKKTKSGAARYASSRRCSKRAKLT